MGGSGLPFLADLLHADSRHILLAFTGGVIFNVANLLLVAAIDIAGLAVAFPVGIGLALAVGAVSSYLITPKGNPWMLFAGVVLVLGAIVLDALAYRLREMEKRATSMRGVVLSLAAGLLMGTFYPFVSKSMQGDQATENGGPAHILMNRTTSANDWIGFRLVGHKSNRDGIGAVIRIGTSGGSQWSTVITASSYLSSGDGRAHFGLGADREVKTVEIRWPSGTVQTLKNVEGDRYMNVDEPVTPVAAKMAMSR